MLANLRHREILNAPRGTVARVQHMAVDMGVVDCRVGRVLKLGKIESAYISVLSRVVAEHYL